MSSLHKWNQILFSSIFVILLILSAYFLFNFLQEVKKTEITIGAGPKNGESYQFASAIAQVANNHYPDLDVRVIETAGSKENMTLLDGGKIDLATVQSDVEASSVARIVSNLYPDMFQLIVRKDAQIEKAQDLKGKRIALSEKGSGQWQSFWFTANHYGIYEDDVEVVVLKPEESVKAFIRGDADALFRVRAPRNSEILEILNQCSAELVPISQAAALKLRRPSLNIGEIPMGTYSGNPLLPSENLPTVSVNRILISHKNTDEEAITKITRVLYERRLELLKLTPLAGFISQPDWGVGTFIPIHEGALIFYDREKPSYFVRNADFLALILSLFVLTGSAVMGLRRLISGNQKNLADKYTNQLVAMLQQIDSQKDINEMFIGEQKGLLYKILEEVVEDLDKDRINIEGFQFFSFTWNTVMNLLKEKEALKH